MPEKSTIISKRKSTTARIFGEEIEIWPASCTRNLNCTQCFFEGRYQCYRPTVTYERISRKNSFYTPTGLARVLGIGKALTIISWMHKGWLKGSRSPCGQRRLWRFDDKDIVKCLQVRPWLADWQSMERHYFCTIIQEEWDKDPWYTTPQAVPLLGIACSSIYRCIRRGLLTADMQVAGRKRSYIIRRSSIKAFLANDPRKRLWHDAAKRNKLNQLRQEGRPTRVAILWNFVCPSCGREVKIIAPPEMVGPEVRKKFITIYINGACFHGAEVELTIPS